MIFNVDVFSSLMLLYVSVSFPLDSTVFLLLNEREFIVFYVKVQGERSACCESQTLIKSPHKLAPMVGKVKVQTLS